MFVIDMLESFTTTSKTNTILGLNSAPTEACSSSPCGNGETWVDVNVETCVCAETDILKIRVDRVTFVQFIFF